MLSLPINFAKVETFYQGRFFVFFRRSIDYLTGLE
jgi:hypothetical protein